MMLLKSHIVSERFADSDKVTIVARVNSEEEAEAYIKEEYEGYYPVERLGKKVWKQTIVDFEEDPNWMVIFLFLEEE